MEVEDRREEPYDSFKIISRKALEDYYKAERKFLVFFKSLTASTASGWTS
jgi:hypothetical protein